MRKAIFVAAGDDIDGSSRRMSDHGQGTTAWRAFLPDQYRMKGFIFNFCIGWKIDNQDKTRGKIWEMDDRLRCFPTEGSDSNT
jgi:hypothetical protein